MFPVALARYIGKTYERVANTHYVDMARWVRIKKMSS